VVHSPCDVCGGDGRVKSEKTIQIDVPAGVADHHYLTLRGQGVPGPRNGPRGDLIAVLDIKDDPRFERHGDDLGTQVEIPFTEAALGTEVEVTLPNDQKLTAEVPAGTQPGQVVTIRGKGIPRLDRSGRGDLHVVIAVTIPKRLSKRAKQLIEELDEELNGDGRRASG